MKGQQRMHDRACSEWTEHSDDTASGVKEWHGITIAITFTQSPLTRNDHSIVEDTSMLQNCTLCEACRPRGVLNLGWVLRPDQGLSHTERIRTDLCARCDHLLEEERTPPLLFEHTLWGRSEQADRTQQWKTLTAYVAVVHAWGHQRPQGRQTVVVTDLSHQEECMDIPLLEHILQFLRPISGIDRHQHQARFSNCHLQ